MQACDDRHLAESVPVNLRAGLQALAAAFCLVSAGIAYHGVLSVGGAAVIAAYAIVVPLRLPSQVFSRSAASFVLQALARVAGVAGLIYVLSIVINSGLPVVDAVASAILIGVLVMGAAIALRAVRRKVLKLIPRVTAAASHARALLNLQLSFALSWVLNVGSNESDSRVREHR